MKQPSQFGSTLRTLMQEREIGMERLSQLAGVSKKTLHNWLRPGGVQRPYAWQPVIQVAQALNLSRSELGALLEAAQQPSLEHVYAQAQTDVDRQLLALWPLETPHKLPPKPQLVVGREDESALIQTYLQHQRLVVLTGPGGSGKTHLALAQAWNALDHFSDGVWWIDLAQVWTPQDVLRTLAQTLELPSVPADQQIQQLAERLRSDHILLVLDNLEQVIEVATDLYALLQATEQVVLLVTSRLRLNIPGEHLVPIKPLAVPPVDAPQSEISVNPAYQLLQRRISALKPDSESHQHVHDLAELCRLVDGLPLALELVGSQVYTQSPQQLVQKLRNNVLQLTHLTGNRTTIERQQTLDATIRWSYDLLPAALQRLWLWLAAFPAGWNTQQALDVLAYSGDLYGEPLTALLEHHMIRRDPSHADWFTMLVPLREWALEELEHRAELFEAQAYQAQWMSIWVKQTEPQLCGRTQHEVIADWMQQLDNIRAALRWFVQHDQIQALRLASLLAEFWAVQGFFVEGRELLEHLLTKDYPDYPELWAEVLGGAGLLARLQSEYVTAMNYHQQALKLWQQLVRPDKVAFIQAQLAMAFQSKGQYEQAFNLLDQALTYYQATQNIKEISKTLFKLTLTALNARKAEEAQAYFEQNMAFGTPGDDSARTNMYYQLGGIAHAHGKYQEALQAWQTSLELYRKLGQTGGVMSSLNLVATALLDLEEPAKAYTYFRQSLHLARQLGHQALIVENLCGLGIIAGLLQDHELVAWISAHIQQAPFQAEQYSYRQRLFERMQAQAQETLGAISWMLAHSNGIGQSLEALLSRLEQQYPKMLT